MTKPLICIDTNLLIYITTTKDHEQQIKNRIISWFLEMNQNCKFMIPPHVIAEFTSVVDVKKQENHRQILSTLDYMSPAFDARCANVAGDIWLEMSKHQTMRHSKAKKPSIKSDLYIAATAVIYRAQKLVTTDVSDFVGTDPQGISAALTRLGHNLVIEEPIPSQSHLAFPLIDQMEIPDTEA